jgi:hypothetical protein
MIGLVGLVIALIIYKATLVGARPVYQRRALRLIGPDAKAIHKAVEIRFKGQPVDRLTKTHIVFWNSGRTLLRGSDVVDTDPIRCDFSDGSRILEVSVVKRTRATNKFEVNLDPDRPHRAIFTFDYIDPGDGAVVEILHTDSKRYPEVNGTVRGVPNGIVDWGRILPPSTKEMPFPFGRRKSLRYLLATVVTLGLLVVAVGVLLPNELMEHLSKFGEPSSSAAFRTFLVVSGLAYVMLPLLLLWLTRRRFPSNLSSPELEE